MKLAGWMAVVAVILMLHWWQEGKGEDGADVWSCHTMGDRDCGPGATWITWQIGGRD